MGRIITMWGVKTLNPVLDESSKEVIWTLMTGIRVVDELFEDEYEEIK